MGRHVAIPDSPLGGRIGKNDAVLSGGKIDGLLATLTFLDDGVARAAVELTSVFAHEEAILS